MIQRSAQNRYTKTTIVFETIELKSGSQHGFEPVFTMGRFRRRDMNRGFELQPGPGTKATSVTALLRAPEGTEDDNRNLAKI